MTIEEIHKGLLSITCDLSCIKRDLYEEENEMAASMRYDINRLFVLIDYLKDHMEGDDDDQI